MTWMTQKWTTGQLNALVKIFGEQKARDILSGEQIVQTTKTKHLCNRQEIPQPREEEAEVKEFYTNPLYFADDDVYFTSDFETRILSDLKIMSRSFGSTFIFDTFYVGESTLVSFDVKSDSNEFEIRNELSEFHIFENELEFCVYLKRMLVGQLQGEEGPLLVDNGLNLFFVKGIAGGLFRVTAGWRKCWPSEGRLDKVRWVVDAGEVGGSHPYITLSHLWHPSSDFHIRVFDRNEQADRDNRD